MKRLIPFPVDKFNLLKQQIGTSGTVVSTDIVGITSNPNFQSNLVRMEVVVSGSAIICLSYKYDPADLSKGFPVNQYVHKIVSDGSFATIQHQENDLKEHWSARLPERTCIQWGCGSCAFAVLRNGSVDVSPCLQNWVSSGTIVPGSL